MAEYEEVMALLVVSWFARCSIMKGASYREGGPDGEWEQENLRVLE